MRLSAVSGAGGRIPLPLWEQSVAGLTREDTDTLLEMLREEGITLEDPDVSECDSEDSGDGFEPSGTETDLEADLEEVLASTEVFPHYNEQGILTREREIELAKIMFHGKQEAILAALSVRCVESVFNRILQFVLRQNGRVWQYFEDPRDDGASETSMLEAVENLTVLVREMERSGDKLAQKATLSLREKDPAKIKLLVASQRRTIRRRHDLMTEHVQYSLRNEFFDELGELFRIGLAEIREAGKPKASFLSDFTGRYGQTPERFGEIAREFFRKVDEFQKARENLVLANQRLVIFFARKYQEQGVDLADLIGEGNIGLLRAVERFDPTKGSRLATYATWWIKHTLNRAVACQGTTIRIPGHVREEKNRILRVMSEMTSTTGTEPSLEEVATRMGMDPGRLHGILQRTQSTVSIDKPLGSDEDEETLQKIIPDAEVRTPEEEVSRSLDFQWLEELLMELSPRERRILELRYGLHGQEMLTLQEVGERLEITRERVRQLQTKAESKIFRMARKLGYK